LAYPEDSRGAYLFFDTSTGDVYLNTSLVGQSGPDPGGRTVKVFSPAVTGQIEFVDGSFGVITDPVDYAAHPVSGVSWFGAIKFCNWMTIASGLPPSERAYTEGPASNLSNWRPVSISSSAWATRDLSEAERQLLVATHGYRLPMDNGADEADAFGEWFKFASARRDAGVVLFDAAYGFGRSQLNNADANFLTSGDPFEAGATPVGFFDGINLLADGTTATSDTENAYRLFDVSGNVWEWMQDRPEVDPLQRRNRGGSWRSTAVALRNDLGSSRGAAATVDSTGFRVVQSVHAELHVVPFDGLSLAGPWGGPFGEDAVTSMTYRIENVVDRTIDVEVRTYAPWLTIEPTFGALAPGEQVDVEVSIAPTCDAPVSVGAHDAAIEFRESGGSVLVTRSAHLEVTEPLRLTPADHFRLTRPFGDTSPSPLRTYTLNNRSASPVSWSVTWEETTPESDVSWLSINDAIEAAGVLEPGQSIPIAVRLDAAEAARLPVGVHEARVSFADECTGTILTRNARIEVMAPFTVSPTDIAESTGPAGGPYHPPHYEYTLTNELDAPVSWSVKVCASSSAEETCPPPEVNWITTSPSSGDLFTQEQATITATVNAAASALATGTHALRVRFLQPATGFTIDREVELTVAGLDVRPATAAAFSGPLGGSFTPNSVPYNVHNNGAKEFVWTATVNYEAASAGLPDVEWLIVSPEFGLILDPFGSQSVNLSVSDSAASLPTGNYEATVTFDDGITDASRGVTLVVGGEGFRVATVLVPGDDVQAGGPDYDFRLGRYEVTNGQFARFLNDALRNRDNERGSYLYHDIDSSSVFIHDEFASDVGSDAPDARRSTRLYDGFRGRISYDPARGLPYVIEAGFEEHPAVGVSWFGAVKFCNWLTLVQGMPNASRIYDEGPDAASWRGVSTSPADFAALPGYRLPMDGGATGAAAASEWHKAASRRGVDAHEAAVFGSSREPTVCGASSTSLPIFALNTSAPSRRSERRNRSTGKSPSTSTTLNRTLTLTLY